MTVTLCEVCRKPMAPWQTDDGTETYTCINGRCTNSDGNVSGRTRKDNIDSATAEWYGSPPGTNDQPLYEFLGWTEEEYNNYTANDQLPEHRQGAF